MPASSTRKGWYNDIWNSRLEARYNDTVFIRGTASAVTIPLATTVSLAFTVTAGGLRVSAGGINCTGDISLTDGDDLVFGDGSDAQIRWSTGDASNHALVIGLGDTNQALHITDNAAKTTDWNISATTHPNVYIHSNTTPATDYLRLGDHDGTTAYIDVVGGTTLIFQIAATSELSLSASQLNVADGNTVYVGVAAVPGTTAGANWIGLEDSTTDPVGTLTNSLAIYTPDAGDSLDFLHADGTTDSLGT